MGDSLHFLLPDPREVPTSHSVPGRGVGFSTEGTSGRSIVKERSLLFVDPTTIVPGGSRISVPPNEET